MNRKERMGVYSATKKKDEDGYDGLTPIEKLLLLIVRRTDGGIGQDHIVELANRAISRCGSIDDAVHAFEMGTLSLEMK